MSPNSNLAILSSLLITAHSFTPPHRTTTHPSTSLSSRRLPGNNPNNKPSWQENAEYWAEQEQLQKLRANTKPTKPARNKTPAPAIGDHIGHVPLDRTPWDEGGNTFAHLYNAKSTDEFKLPFENQRDIVERMERNTAAFQVNHEFRRDVTQNGVVPEWFGKNSRQINGDVVSEEDRKILKSAREIVYELNDVKPKRQLQGTAAADALSNPYGEGTKRHSFQTSSRDDFRRPYDGHDRDIVPEWFGSNTRNLDKPPVNSKQLNGSAQITNANIDPGRHTFQISTTDDFRQPYGMPNSNQQPPQLSPPQKKHVFKSPFQTSTTEDFKRPSDSGTQNNAPQQAIYAEFTKTSERNAAWKNSVGQDAYESTQLPQAKPLGGSPNNRGYSTNPSQSAAILTMEDETDGYNSRKREDTNMLLGSIQWKDPLHDAPPYPLLLTRVFVTILATISTWYLHLINGFSPVLASSVVSFLLSTCYDRRLGQVALCGALAGMSGGHLLPNLSATLMLGGMTSGCYEIFLQRCNLFGGIGGRIGATAFLATSILAKYRHVHGVGRKLRRGIWKAGAGPSSIVVSMVLFHVLGALGTILLRQSSQDDGAADPVRASSVVGILGSLFIADPTSLMALYGGSFVGMSLPSRLTHGGVRIRQRASLLIASFAGAGAIAGLFHAVTMHYGYWNGGWGGKAGLCAFAGCLAYRGLDNVIRFNRNDSL
jgi:hypothetical protein